jgi:hypothetical protein
MYVRWKTKKLAHSVDGVRERSLYAVLVASERRNGKPRQRVIKHLAFINERDLASIEERRRFWLQADSALSTVETDDTSRRNLLARMDEVIPCPPDMWWLKESGRTVAAGAELLPGFEQVIDWDREIVQNIGQEVVCHGRDRIQYVIPQEIFIRLNPLLRSRIRMAISQRQIARSIHSIQRAMTMSHRFTRTGERRVHFKRFLHAIHRFHSLGEERQTESFISRIDTTTVPAM